MNGPMHRVIDRAARPVMLTVENLRHRWEDEGDYEDWKDYEDALRVAVELAGMSYIESRQQPFGVVVRMRMVKPEVLIWSHADRNGWTIEGGAR